MLVYTGSKFSMLDKLFFDSLPATAEQKLTSTKCDLGTFVETHLQLQLGSKSWSNSLINLEMLSPVKGKATIGNYFLIESDFMLNLGQSLLYVGD